MVLPSGDQAGKPLLRAPWVSSLTSDPSALTSMMLAGRKLRPPKKVPKPTAIHWQSGDQLGIRLAPSGRWKIFLRSEPSGFITLSDAVGLPVGKSRSVIASLPFFLQNVGNTSV